MIHARGLARSFRTSTGVVSAVRGVDLDVAPGEIVGFLGPNGAGKSTTLRMLTTLLAPDAGTATVAGADLRAEPAEVRRRIGFVGQAGSAGPDVPIGEELRVQARLYGIPAGRAAARAAELAEALDLQGLDRRLTRTLSGGQRRRLDVALALVHAPSLLFLDEPSAGLDPQSRANLWSHVRSLRDRAGVTVFLSTHYLDEADELCDRVLVIDGGRIVGCGTPDELKERVSGDAVQLAVADPGLAARVADRLPGVHELTVYPDGVRFRVRRADTVLPVLLRALDQAAVPLRAVNVRRPSLDDVFLAVTGRSLRDGSVAAASQDEELPHAG